MMTQSKFEKIFTQGVIACLGLALFLSLGCEKSGGLPTDFSRPSTSAPCPKDPEIKEQVRKMKYQIIENKSRIDQLESQKMEMIFDIGHYEYFSELDKAKISDAIDDEMERLTNENDELNGKIMQLGGEPYLLL